MAFPDDELDPAPSGPARRGRPPGQRDIFFRRLIALGAGILILILLLLGFRACLDSRKERGFENYASDVNSAARGSNDLSVRFFERLQTPPERSAASTLQGQIAGDRVGTEANLQQIEAVDVPDEVADANADLVRAFELRRDAVSNISEQISTALGDDGRDEAIGEIADDMRALLASDVLYARAEREINAVLAEEEIDAQIEASVFLPDPVESWLDEFQLTGTLNAFATSAGECNQAVSTGVEMSGVTLNDTDLIDGGENEVPVEDPISVEALVTNAGTTEVTDVAIRAEISGPGGALIGEGSITRINPGLQRTATFQIDGEPEQGTPLTIEVSAIPVNCEQLLDNNSLTYTLTFD